MIILTKWYLECILSLRIVKLKEKEGMASEIFLSKDLMHLKFRYNRCISILKLYLFVLVFIPIELHWNFKLYCLYYFFLKMRASNWGCGLSTGAASTWTFTVLYQTKILCKMCRV